MPAKEAALTEVDRVLRPAGRLQVADAPSIGRCQRMRPQRIDLWTG
jgi:ubiquinone/menaquinone biosynthesis C-methylase UbiE